MKSLLILSGLFISIIVFQTASTGPDKVYEPETTPEVLMLSHFAQADPRTHDLHVNYHQNVTTGIENITPNMPVTSGLKPFVMIKYLSDDCVVAGLFNRANDQEFVTIEFTEIGLKGKKAVRDLWRQKNIGRYKDKFTALVPARGVVIVKIGK